MTRITFEGGGKQKSSLAGEEQAPIENFQEGKWLEHRAGRDKTGEGKVSVRVSNTGQGSNAVISIIEWVEKK